MYAQTPSSPTSEPLRPLIVLVGPACSGKSTLGQLVASELGVPFVDLDAVAAPYYAEAGWSIDRLTDRIGAVGRVAAEREWEPARIHAVERVVKDHPGAVIAFGAGHTSYTDPAYLERLRDALTRPLAVVRLSPSADRDLALRVLRTRSIAATGSDRIHDGHDLLAEWLDDPVVSDLATHTVYTYDDLPAQTAHALVTTCSVGVRASSLNNRSPGRA